MNEITDFQYDDFDALKFIKNFLPEHVKNKYNDNDIHYIVDLIYEFYESKGFLDCEDDLLEVEINEDELVKFVIKNALADGVGKYVAEDVTSIVEAELAYCDSIGMYE